MAADHHSPIVRLEPTASRVICTGGPTTGMPTLRLTAVAIVRQLILSGEPTNTSVLSGPSNSLTMTSTTSKVPMEYNYCAMCPSPES